MKTIRLIVELTVTDIDDPEQVASDMLDWLCAAGDDAPYESCDNVTTQKSPLTPATEVARRLGVVVSEACSDAEGNALPADQALSNLSYKLGELAGELMMSERSKR